MNGRGWLWLAAIVAGFALGLLYAWVWSPPRQADTMPSTLRADFKDSFRVAIASAYAETGNLERASARLRLLGDSDSVAALSAQAQHMLAAGQSFQAARELAALAVDLQAGVSSVATAVVAEPAPLFEIASPATGPASGGAPTSAAQLDGQTQVTTTVEALFTPSPRPTRTPAPTPNAPFGLVSKELVCNANVPAGLMQIVVLDARGQPMPGVEIAISWSTGADRVFTGLKPEIGNGYADYGMLEGLTYSVAVGGGLPPFSGLVAPACPDVSGQSQPGGLKLTFQQP